MALFKSDDIYSPDDHTELILLDCFKVPEGEPIPTLVILFTPRIRQIESRAAKQHNGFRNLKFVVGIDGEDTTPHGEAEQVDEPQEYCEKVLSVAYKDSTNIFDLDRGMEPTKELMLATIAQKPVFARAIASALMGFFQSKDVTLKEDTETDRKNS